MTRSKTTRNLFDKKSKNQLTIHDPILREVIGPAERKGCWVVYGSEKNGKTQLALMIAKDLSKSEKVGYISAEEGTDDSFTMAVRRAGIVASDKILWDEYLSIDEIIEKFSKPRTPNIIVVDNLTMYADELKPSELKKKLIDALPSKLFILLGHEERKEAYPALAKWAKKIAKVIFHVEGLKAFVTSRFAKGGEVVIDEEKSALYWGDVN